MKKLVVVLMTWLMVAGIAIAATPFGSGGGVFGSSYPASVSVTPEQYGAVGNGTTNDTAAFLLAIASGKTVVGTLGKTYRIDGTLTLSANQVFEGNGCLLIRAGFPFTGGQSVGTTTTAINGSTTSVVVTDGSQFVIGMWITFHKGAQPNIGWDIDNATQNLRTISNPTRISNIVGNTLTVSSAPLANVSFTGTTDVTTNFPMLVLSAGSIARNLNIDGRKSVFPSTMWATDQEIELLSAPGAIVENCNILNAAGEGIMVSASDYAKIKNCTITAPAGNGIHLSGSIGVLIDGCTISSPNQVTKVGHVMGGVGWSNVVSHTTVTNCYFYGGIGIGGIDSVDNSDTSITENTFNNCTLAIKWETSAGGTTPLRTLVSNNRMYNCVSVSFNGELGVQSADVVFSNNIMYKTNLIFDDSANLLCTGNFISLIDITDQTSMGCVALSTNSGRCIVSENEFVGGNYAVSATASSTDILITQNIMYNQYHWGILLGSSASGVYEIANNIIRNTSAAYASYYGITFTGANTYINHNRLTLAKGAGGIEVYAAGVIERNTIVGTADDSILVHTGGLTPLIDRNLLFEAVNDAGGVSVIIASGT
jgi:hypothetical protein